MQGFWVQALGVYLESWVVRSGAISPVIWVTSTVTLLITTHEPPSGGMSVAYGFNDPFPGTPNSATHT